MSVYIRAAAILSAALLCFTAPYDSHASSRAPKGPIEITLGTSAGGTPDVVMRRVTRLLTELGIVDNPFVIQNRTGGGWMVAINHVLNRPGDENTVLVMPGGSFFATPAVQKLEPVYDKVTPIAVFVQADVVAVVQADSPFNSIEELLEASRQKPLSVTMGGAHAAGAAALALGLFEATTGVEINYVPYDGGGAAQAAFMGGHVDMVMINPDEALPHVKAGKARILAIFSEERRSEPELADIPTMKELGHDMVWHQMFGLVGPPGLDSEVVAWWDERLRELVATEEWKAMIAENYHRSNYVGPDELRAHLAELNEIHLAALRARGLID